jgi:large subunit ribosomal protein L19e
MTIATVRRLAADLLDVGQNKIRIRPDGLKEAEGALTRTDVQGLIDKGIVTKAKPGGRASTAKTGRKGHGSRRGPPLDPKSVWIAKVRSQRKFLRTLVGAGTLAREHKRALYNKVKSGIFRNKRAMLLYLKDNNLVPADYEPPKAESRTPAHKMGAGKRPETGIGRQETPKAVHAERKAEHKKETKPAAAHEKEGRHAHAKKGESQ